MRLTIAVQTSRVLRAGPFALLLPASACRAEDAAPAINAPGERSAGVELSLQYVFNAGSDWRLMPVASLRGGKGLWSGPEDHHLLFVHYGVDAGATSPPKSREDLARSLLLPDGFAFRLGAAHDWSDAKGTRFVSPDVSVGAQVVPWHADTTALRVGISAGIGVSSSRIFDASIRVTRAVNAFGERDRKRVLAASDGPDIWSSDLAATAGLHSRRADLGVFGAFGAYLFDSKFHVPPGGRRVFAVGVRKGFG